MKKMMIIKKKYQDGSDEVKKHLISDGLGKSPLKPGMKGYNEELKRRESRVDKYASLTPERKKIALETTEKAMNLRKSNEDSIKETLKKAELSKKSNVVGQQAQKTMSKAAILNEGKNKNIQEEAKQNSADEANIYKEREKKKQAYADELNKKAKGVKKMMLYKKGSKNC